MTPLKKSSQIRKNVLPQASPLRYTDQCFFSFVYLQSIDALAITAPQGVKVPAARHRVPVSLDTLRIL
jgi:hypothetical protein